jgi:hypothetical protein
MLAQQVLYHFNHALVLQIWTFVSFFSLICLVRSSSTRLTRSGENNILWLVSDLKEESFGSFTINYDVSCGIFIDALYWVEEVLYILVC